MSNLELCWVVKWGLESKSKMDESPKEKIYFSNFQ